MAEEKHAKASPSRLERIFECAGSFKACLNKEQSSSSYAEEGTMLHYAVERFLRPIAINKRFDELTDPKVNPNIVKPEYPDSLNQEQCIAVEECLMYLSNVLKPIVSSGEAWSLHIEERVYLDNFNSVLSESHGTADIIIRADSLHVIDWKFGQGIYVSVKGNDQLYAYSTGAVVDRKTLLKYNKVVMHIAQPRLDNYSMVEMDPRKILLWVDSRAVPGMELAYQDNAPFKAGLGCKWCPIKNTCRTRYDDAVKIAADVFAAHVDLSTEVSLKELEVLYGKAKQYATYIKDTEKYLKQKLFSGKELTTLKMVNGRNSRSWDDENTIIEYMLEAGFSYDELFISKLLSPAQAEKLNRKLKKDKDFQALIRKAPGKPSMVHINDSREALEFKDAAKVFAGIVEEE